MRIDSSANLQFNSGFGSVATAFGCRAWVNFNGTGTPAIRASGNVSSITDVGTGDYRVNYTNNMPDVNNAIVGMTQDTVFVNAGGITVLSSQEVNRYRQLTCNTSGVHVDMAYIASAVFR